MITKLKKFSNGLRLVMVQNNNLHSVSTGVFVEAGSAFENDENNGVSHFIEHNLFKGTKRRNSFEISDCIDRIGGQMNAYTSKEMTCYYTKTTKEHLELSVDLISDIIFNSLFDEKELNKERGVILEEISMYEDTPDDLCTELLAQAYFKSHPLGRTILGRRENIENMGRKHILDYMSTNYTPNNMVISVCGNFSFEECETLCEKYFVEGRGGEKVDLPSIPTIEPKSEFISRSKSIEQCHIAFAIPSVPYGDKLLLPNMILNNVFGGGMSSRLFQSIREDKGLAYTVYSYNSTYKSNGSLIIYAGVNPSKTLVATKAIREEIDKIKKDKITKEEFERGKAQTIGSYVFAEENPLTVMNLFGKNLLLRGEVYDFSARIKEMKDIAYDDVIDIIEKTYDMDNVVASMVGNKEENILKEFIK